MKNVEIKIYSALAIISLILSGILIDFQISKQDTKLYRNGELIAVSDWFIEAERTYFNLNSYYNKNIKCPKIEAIGGYRTKTRCYYPDDYYKRIKRNLIKTKIDYHNLSNQYTITKTTPYYRYGTKGAIAGNLYEGMNFDKETQREEKFPTAYNVMWSPKDTRNYKLTWRLRKIDTSKYSNGNYTNCDYSFGNVKIDLKDECRYLDYVEIKDDVALIHFYNWKGTQTYNLGFYDPPKEKKNKTNNEIKVDYKWDIQSSYISKKLNYEVITTKTDLFGKPLKARIYWNWKDKKTKEKTLTNLPNKFEKNKIIFWNETIYNKTIQKQKEIKIASDEINNYINSLTEKKNKTIFWNETIYNNKTGKNETIQKNKTITTINYYFGKKQNNETYLHLKELKEKGIPVNIKGEETYLNTTKDNGYFDVDLTKYDLNNFNVKIGFATTTITLTELGDGAYTNNQTPDFIFTVSGDNDSYSCELFIDETGFGKNETTINNTQTTITANHSISEGVHSYYYNCTNGTTYQSDTYTFTVDITNPILSFVSPTPDNDASLNENEFGINITIDEINLDTFDFDFDYTEMDDYLVGYWRFDNNSNYGENNTLTYDYSGNGNNGTIKNGATYTAGKKQLGLEFDGTDDYVEIADDESLDITDAITVEAWVYLKGENQNYNLFDKRIPLSWGQGGYNIYIDYSDANGVLKWNMCNAGENLWSSEVYYGSAIPVNQWIHIALTWDGSTVKYYYDGSLDTSHAGSGTMGITDRPLIIGSRSDAPYDTFHGTIDEVRIYNTSLSAEQIKQRYLSTRARYYDDSLVLAMNFNNNSAIGENSTKAVDISKYKNNGTIHGATWDTDGKFGSALNFDGTDDYVDCGNDESLDITDEITIEAWVKKEEFARIESILSKGPYSLKIGSDNKPYIELIADSETIADVGQLGSSDRVLTLAVYNGNLYGGTGSSGRVYRYDGGTTWTDVGRLGSDVYVISLAVYDGKLYGGTGASGRVYRYDGGTTWTDVGRLGSNSYVVSLAVYDGKLYAGTEPSGRVYRYDGGTTWTDIGRLGENSKVYSLVVYDGKLYGGTVYSGRVYRYDGGTTWTDVGQLGSNSQVRSLAVYDGKLYGGTYNSGRVYRYDGGTTWTDVGRLGSNTYVTSLVVYDGKLYGGTGASGRVYRYDGGTTWTDVGQLGSNTYVWSLAVYDGKLYGGTYDSGKVYSIGQGTTAYSDTEITTQYAHICGVYDGSTTKIYVNGNQKGSDSAAITIDIEDFPLLVGASAGSSQGGYSGSGEDYFNGAIDEVRIYNRALSADEIKTHYQSEFSKYNSTQYRFWTNQSNLTDGTYNYYSWVNDSAGNENETEIRTLDITTCFCHNQFSIWNIDMADHCIINDNCNMGAKDIIFSSNGNCTFNSTINASKITNIPASSILYIGENCNLKLNGI